MEEILYLEPDEEITSVIDKMKQAKSKRLALVVPREATILQSVVNLKLLLREAANSGKEIALVTADKIGRNLAAQVGLVVYDSIKDRRPQFLPPAPTPGAEEVIEIDMAEEKKEEEPRPKGVQIHHFQKEKSKATEAKPWTGSKVTASINWSKTRKIVWPMLAVVVFLLLVAAFLTLPKVSIKVQVKSENFTKSQGLQISAEEPTNLDQNIFAGNLIDLTREKEEKFIATGKKNLGGKAEGTLTLYNYWDSSAQGLEKGSKFSSSSKTFVSKNSVTIPGTSIRGGNIVPGTATVEIEAENPGEEYNVKAGRFTIVGLPAAQQEKIYGQASKDLSGGFSKEVTVVSGEDFDRAKDKLTKAVEENLHQELEEKAQGMEVLDKAIQMETVEVESSTEAEAEANEFTFKAKVRLRVMVFERALFDKFVINCLEKQVPYDKMITLGPNDSIMPAEIEPKYDQGRLNLKVEVTAKISSRVDREKIKKDLVGKGKTAAEEYLDNLAGAAGFQINFSPSFWLKRIPNYPRSLKVELEYLPVAASTPSPIPSPVTSPEVSPTLSPTESIE